MTAGLQWLSWQGQPCHDGATIQGSGLRSGSFVRVHWRLRGGGGDGGSTGAESRASYLEMYAGKKQEKVTVQAYHLCRVCRFLHYMAQVCAQPLYHDAALVQCHTDGN